jgi:predicted transcriptional regulator
MYRRRKTLRTIGTQPKLLNRFSAALSDDDLAALNAIAEQRRTSRNALLRLAIHRLIQQETT